MNSDVWLVGLIASIVLFQLVFFPAAYLRKNDLADVLWGPAFLLSALAAAQWGLPNGLSSLDTRSILLLTLVGIWALRLFMHVGLRNLSHKSEDVRYNNWRKEWGKNWLLRTYFQVFVLQALILYIFVSPVLLSIASDHRPLGFLSGLGLLVWLGGFLLESIADEQLRRFKSEPHSKGRLMTHGVWSWSRHPNYFGEVVQWWGLFLVAAELPWGWATVLSPIGVTYLILKISGVSMLEDLMRGRPGFQEYAKRTSIFFPLPPKTRPP